jgi:uncharacterized protein (TIGR03437 family)
MRALPIVIFAFFQLNLFGAVPSIGGIVNSAGNNDAPLPNGGIAQGAIFTIFGSNMGPATLTYSDLPRLLTLAGTVVTVTSGSFTASAPLIYTSANQVAAIMPSATPVGNATLTVTYNGTPGAGSPVAVVSSNIGLFTVSQNGAGPAVVDFADYSLVTAANSAQPGQTLVLWGTGLGAISGSDALGALGGNLSAPVQVYAGGVAASVVYQGRSPGSTGLDQINFVVPTGVYGCNVSLAVQTGGIVSNNAVISIAPGGGQCSDPAGYPNLQTQLSKSSVTLAALLLDIGGPSINAQGTPPIDASAYFVNFTQKQFAAQYAEFFTVASPGSCVTTVYRGGSGGSSGLPGGAFLDAGPALDLTNPVNQPFALTEETKGVYSGELSAFTPGIYTFSNGSGGADIKAFSQSFNIPDIITWSTLGDVSSIDRTQALNMVWSGGDPAGYVQVNAAASVLNASALSVGVTCVAPVTANQMSIPPAMLLALPPNGGGALTVKQVSGPTISIPGADATVVVAGNSQTISAQFH